MIKVLLITSKQDVTTDFIVKQLRNKSIDFYRFNTEDLLGKISLNFDFSEQKFTLYDNEINLEIDLLKIKSVYYRRPLVPKFSLQNLSLGQQNFIASELTYTLEGLYKILDKAFWISPVYAIREAENKIFQLQLAKDIGFTIPNSLITTIPNKAHKFTENWESVLKPIKTGLLEEKENDSIIFTTKLKDNTQLERVKACPTYIQKFIDKSVDLRVTVIGEKVFAAKIFSQEYEDTKVDWRSAETIKLRYEKFVLPESLIKKCIVLTKRLKLNFGAIDFVQDGVGDFLFLEINPNGQWAWIEKLLGYPISEEIANLLDNNKA